MNSQSFLIFLLLIGLVFTSILFEKDILLSNNFIDSKILEDPQTEKPEYEISDFNSKSYNKKTGRLEYKLDATKLEFYKNDKKSTLELPYVEVFKEALSEVDSPNWTINSKEAFTKTPNDIIYFKNNVHLERIPQSITEEPLKIESNALTILLDEKIAKTPYDVDIYSNQSTIHGLGLEAELETEKIKIHNNVKSEYINDNQVPTAISSKRLTFDNLKNEAKYEGNVELTQDNIAISADTLVFHKKGLQQIAIATGNPAIFKQTSSYKNEDIHAQANRLEYNTEDNILKMFDNAKLQQGAATVEGAYLFYDTRKETIGAESTEASRVKMVIPKKNNQEKTNREP